MAIIGVRTSIKHIRYAIVERQENDDFTFINRESENRIVFPKSIESIEQKLHWFKQEFERILTQYDNIEKIALKTSEYSRQGETKAGRNSAYMDGVILLLAAQTNIPVETYIYTQLKTKSKEVKSKVEELIGVTPKYWDVQMADALIAAIKEAQ